MPRKPWNEKVLEHDQRFHLTLTAEQRVKLIDLAHAAKVTQSQILRELIEVAYAQNAAGRRSIARSIGKLEALVGEKEGP